MAWNTIDRITPVVDEKQGPVLTEAVKDKIRTFFDRYETKRAALLPALHVVQESTGQVSHAAMLEVAELLEIAPSDIFDVVGFYTHFWAHAKGRKVVVCCRSISCECLGSDAVLEAFKMELGIGEHETTPDGEYSLMTEECLAGCDYGPCVLINEKMHKRVRPQDVPGILADANNATIDVPRSSLFDPPAETETRPAKSQEPAAEEPDAPSSEKQEPDTDAGDTAE